MKKIAINGFGRIGRIVFRIIEELDDMEVVAINTSQHSEPYTTATPEGIAYLLKYDTVHGRYDKEVTYDDKYLFVDGRKIEIYHESDPKMLPWDESNIDVVLECTGKFTKKEDAMLHIEAGAKKVLISAPGKGDMKTVVFNVNDEILTDDDIIVSAASCTTNCLAPVLKVLDDNYHIISCEFDTTHAYTSDQETLDGAHSKGIMERRGRACAENIVPASTGAAKAIGKVLPNLNGKVGGTASRVPVPDGSLLKLVVKLEKKVTVEEINKTFFENVNETLEYSKYPIVSSDIIGTSCGAMIDGCLTSVTEYDRQSFRVYAWYDNEMGYSHQMVRTLRKM